MTGARQHYSLLMHFFRIENLFFCVFIESSKMKHSMKGFNRRIVLAVAPQLDSTVAYLSSESKKHTEVTRTQHVEHIMSVRNTDIYSRSHLNLQQRPEENLLFWTYYSTSINSGSTKTGWGWLYCWWGPDSEACRTQIHFFPLLPSLRQSQPWQPRAQEELKHLYPQVSKATKAFHRRKSKLEC